MLSDILVNIVWFKRDLRIQDHAPLYQATQKSLLDKNNMVIPVFSWDASVWSSQDYSQQHVAFVHECLLSLKKDLQAIGLELFETQEGMVNFLNVVSQQYRVVVSNPG
ncbi:MAG: deoxyribodipyrimidine photo-lyase [Methylophilaceae bacterium]